MCIAVQQNIICKSKNARFWFLIVNGSAMANSYAQNKNCRNKLQLKSEEWQEGKEKRGKFGFGFCGEEGWAPT